MRKIITAMTFITIILLTGATAEAKTSSKTRSKSKVRTTSSTTTNYKLKETSDGYKSPVGYSYTAKLSAPNRDYIVCTKIIMSFINPEVVKVQYYADSSWSDDKYYAWHQDKDYIFLSDEKDPLIISDNGKTLTSVNTGLIYNISSTGTKDIFRTSPEDMIFVEDFYKRPWIFSPDGTATRSFSEVHETGRYSRLDGNAFKVQFETDEDYEWQQFFENYLIANDTVYKIHVAYTESDHRLMTPRVNDFTYNPDNQTITFTKINGSSNVQPYLKELYDPMWEGKITSPTVPINFFEKIGVAWKKPTKQTDGENQVVGTFTFKGQKFILLKNGSVILRDRSRDGEYVKEDGGKSYQVYTWSPFYEGGDSFMIIGNNVYSIDIGCCACVYQYSYDWKKKIVICKGGCDDEEITTTKTPLSKMKPVATITWAK